MIERSQSGFKPALMLMSGRTVAFAATFFIPVVLSRVFTRAEFGTYKQFFLIVYALYGIAQMGMAESLFFFLPSSRTGAGRYVFNSIIALSCIGSVFLIGLFVLSPVLAQWMSNAELETHSLAAGLYLLLMLIGCVLEIVWINRKRYRWATLSYAFSDLSRAGLLILPALVFRSIHAVIVGGLVFCAVRVATMFILVRREFPGELRPDWTLMKLQFRYAIPFALAVIVDVAQANYHQIAVSRRFDAATFAIYAIGC